MFAPSRTMPFPVLAALITVQILFGVNYVISKQIVGAFPPLIWAHFRILVSTISLFAIARLSKRPAPCPNRKFFGPLILFSFLGVVINQCSFLVGLSYTTATNSSVLTTLIPVFTLLFVTLLGKESFTYRKSTGFIFALVGVLIIRGVENFSLSDQTLLGDALIVVNCVSYGLFLTFSKDFLTKYDPIWTTAWMFFVGSLVLLLVTGAQWTEFQLPPLDTSLILAMAFSIFGSTLLAYLLNTWALSQTRASSVAFFIYLQPLVTSLFAWSYFGIPANVRTLVAGAFIFIGMILAMPKIVAIPLPSDLPGDSPECEPEFEKK